MTDLPTMRAAFRVSESHGDPDKAKRRYEMRFSFPTMEAMHKADDEWRAFAIDTPVTIATLRACYVGTYDAGT